MSTDATANLDIVISAKNQASDGLNKVNSDLANTSKNSTDLNKTFTKVGVAIAAVGAGITLYAKNATDFTVQLTGDTKKLSRETGLATDEASRLLYVTGRLGIDADSASQVFGLFSKKIAETANAADPASTSLGKLGISIEDANHHTKSFNDILLETADKFKSLPNGPEKTALALDLFGRSGKDMIKVLNLGSEGITKLEQDADKLGLTLNAKTVVAVSKYITSQKNLKDTTDALKLSIGALTAPVLTKFNETINRVVSAAISTNSPFRGLIANVLAFGGPILSAAGGAIAFGANISQMGLTLAKVGVAIKAFATFMTGPWGIAITVAVVAITALVSVFNRHKKATTDLSSAQQDNRTVTEELADQANNLARDTDRLTQATDALKSAQNDLTNADLNLQDSRLGVEGANLRVEQAQKDYDQAVRDHGKTSLEARTADYDLASARLGVQKANQDVAAATKDLADKTSAAALAQQEMNTAQGIMVQNTQAVVQAIDMRYGKLDNVRQLAVGIGDTIMHMDNSLLAVQQTGQNVTTFLTATFGGVQGNLNNIQKSFGDLGSNVDSLQSKVNNLNSSSASKGIKLGTSFDKGVPLGHNASGTDYWRGGPTTVNEQGQEIIDLPTGSRIYPADESKKMMGGQTTVTIQNMYLTTAEATREFFEMQDRNSLLAAKGLSVVRA